MTVAEMADFVTEWFHLAGQANGPLLPDGWHGGRVRDSIFLLRDVQAVGEVLTIRLSENTTLTFDQARRVHVENSDLVFGDFRRATLRWRHYGGGTDAPYYERSYEQGEVRLAAPLGTTVRM